MGAPLLHPSNKTESGRWRSRAGFQAKLHNRKDGKDVSEQNGKYVPALDKHHARVGHAHFRSSKQKANMGKGGPPSRANYVSAVKTSAHSTIYRHRKRFIAHNCCDWNRFRPRQHPWGDANTV